ncbi:MAG: AI-2E family transporter [Cyclobacteriaceae bacterium]|nr:AI-2E family transporter [Cyclobacteriaceae bacterium]
MSLSLRTTFYTMACTAGLFILMYYGQPILVPMSIAILFAFILFPICKRLEKWGLSRIPATLISMVAVISLLLGVIYLFSTQIVNLISDFSDFENKLRTMFDSVVNFVNNKVPLLPEIKEQDIIEKGEDWAKNSGGAVLSNTFNTTVTVLSGLLMSLIFTFLLLIYRSGLVDVVVKTFRKQPKNEVLSMVKEMQQVGQHYLLGMSIMILILGFANSGALLALGIDHFFFFGFLAAMLAIIPYVGTTLGATLPTLYALMTEDSYWVPIGVVLCFWFIQLIESNFLSPKIVGGKLNINALMAIISLIVGGYIWGIPGMALFLPLMAIAKVFFNHFEQFKPVAMLMGDDLYDSGREGGIRNIKKDIKKVFKKIEK